MHLGEYNEGPVGKPSFRNAEDLLSIAPELPVAQPKPESRWDKIKTRFNDAERSAAVTAALVKAAQDNAKARERSMYTRKDLHEVPVTRKVSAPDNVIDLDEHRSSKQEEPAA